MASDRHDAGTRDEATVLVVDDDEPLADLYSNWLHGEYEVRTAYDGREALEQLDEAVDVVFLDRQMPGLSGDEVLDRVRDRGYDCRVAIVTGVTPDFDVLELGFDDYLRKPVSEDGLLKTARKLFARMEYSDGMAAFFGAVRKRELLCQEKGTDALEDSERYQRLDDHIDALQNRVDAAAADLDAEDYEALFHDLGPDDPGASGGG